MKIFLPFLSALTLFFAACSKTNSSSVPLPPAGISASLNGHPYTFNNTVRIDISNGEIAITAAADSGGGYLEIVVDGTTSFTPGIYPNASIASNSTFNSELGYVTTLNNSEQLYGSTDDSVSVLAITDSTFIGTFHGKVTRDDSTIVIKNGKFNVRL